MFLNVTYARRLCKKNTQDNQASFIAIVQKNRHQAIKWLLISKALTVLSSTRTYECVVGQLWLPNIIPEAWRKNFRVSRGFVYNLAEDTEVNARAPITVPFFANDRFLCGRAKTIQTQNQRALRASSFMLWLKFALSSWTC